MYRVFFLPYVSHQGWPPEDVYQPGLGHSKHVGLQADQTVGHLKHTHMHTHTHRVA